MDGASYGDTGGNLEELPKLKQFEKKNTEKQNMALLDNNP